MDEDELRAVRIGELKPLAGKIEIADYDPAWPSWFAREEAQIRAALGERVLLLEHVGSTSVPGLAAKPRINILLAVASSADEAAYVPALEAAGYRLHIREPKWREHRLLKGPDTAVNLHVFSRDCTRSASSRAATGSTAKSTPMRRRTSSRRSSLARAGDPARTNRGVMGRHLETTPVGRSTSGPTTSWQYKTTRDKMREEETRFAQIASINSERVGDRPTRLVMLLSELGRVSPS